MTDPLPLADLKVLDLSWVLAAPGATRMLADYGATVVRVESGRRVDPSRTLEPFHAGKPGGENSGLFQNINAGKLCLSLDLARPEAQEIVRDLVRWSDVVTESFAPGVVAAWGLDYESLRRIKPDLIMLSSSLLGQTGPLRRMAGYGNLAASLGGFQSLAAWPDRAPAGPFGAYTDFIAVRYNAVALLAALDHRARTGEGQYIDMSQTESALHFLAPAWLDYTVNGRLREAMGNDDPGMAPHGVYPCAGEDRWVAIAARSNPEWVALCQAMGRSDLAQDARLTGLPGRLAHRAEIDGEVASWTRTQDAHQVESTLQAQGVPASAVLDMADLYADPQLRHREHFVELEHPLHQRTTVESSRFRLSRTPARRPRAAILGRDNRTVLREILGYREERIDALESRGILR